MEFTYVAYVNMLRILRNNDYVICGYHDYIQHEKCVILRHDVDVSLEKALQFAVIEKKHNACSTYFILLSSDFYNIASAKSLCLINEIKNNGHEIGLHFDEANYNYFPKQDICSHIEREIRIMSEILEMEISTVSMHRPSKKSLTEDYKLQNATNSYSKIFFEEFKYVSDSRRFWRESVIDIISRNTFKKLHILTHAFWYSENSVSASDVIKTFVNSASVDRYNIISDNITDIEEFMKPQDILVL